MQGWDKEFPNTFQLDVPNGNILVIFNFYLDKIRTPDFPGGSVVKNPPANAGDARDMGLITGSERSPGEGDGNPFQYSCLENPMAHGQRSLGGYSLWSCKESDMTEVTKWQHNSHTMKCTLVKYNSVLFYSQGYAIITINSRTFLSSPKETCGHQQSLPIPVPAPALYNH